ncbi:hypothetical protein ACFLVF_02425 [Chloroflexota bacterium]
MRHWSWVIHLFIIIALSAPNIFGGCLAPSLKSDSKAAIIDQLHILYPNQAFIEQTTRELEKFGFQVDVYRGDAASIELYRELPEYGYELIIFRVHSGLLGVDPRVVNRTWLYTAEPYSKTRYVAEQLTDQVTYANTQPDAPWFFAVSAKFINRSMKGQFNDTAIIMMGCDGLYYEDLAQAFIDKGASTYIAWNASVVLDYVDSSTPVLMENLCSKKLKIGVAVAQTMSEKGPDPRSGATLRYYPRQSASKTLRQLTK